MMQKKLLVATILCIAVLGQGSASAETVLDKITKDAPKTATVQKAPEKEEPPKITTPPVEYIVVQGDTLIGVSKTHTTTWERLWAKNTALTDPDLIKPGDRLTIPREDEVLPARPLPTPVIPAQPTAQPYSGPVTGNTYTPGQCTWYVKNRKPTLPNNLGNASSWLYNAQAQGMATGTTPRAGAVGWTSGHVVYVESVNADGTVNVSDMNGRWIPYEIGHWTYPASKYVYIY